MSVRERLREIDRWALDPKAPGMKVLVGVMAAIVIVTLVIASFRVERPLLIGPVIGAAIGLMIGRAIRQR